MTEKLHRLIRQASEIYNYVELGDIAGFSDKKAARWATRPLHSVDYIPYSEDALCFARLSKAIERIEDGSRPPEEQAKETLNDGRVVLEGSVGGKIPTRQEILDHFDINLDLFEITRERLLEKTTEMKLEYFKVDEESGKVIRYQTPHSHRGYTYRFELKPIKEAHAWNETLEVQWERIRAAGPVKVPQIFIPDSTGDPHLLCLHMPDVHLGKLAADGNFTIKDTLALHEQALHGILEVAGTFNLSEVLWWLGNDLTQADTVRGQTTRGTQVEQCDTWYNQLDAGIELGKQTIYTLLKYIDKVTVSHIPGNHSWHTEHSIARALREHFWQEDRVEIRTNTKGRDAVVYGNNLLVGSHGNNNDFKRGAASIPIEYPNEWASCPYRELHTGHLHFKDAGTFISNYSEKSGVLVRQASSLSPTDTWHAVSGFVGSLRAAEGYVYCKENGLRTSVNWNAPVDQQWGQAA